MLLVLAWLTLVAVICWTSNMCHFFARSTWNQFLVRMYEGFRHVLICNIAGGSELNLPLQPARLADSWDKGLQG